MPHGSKWGENAGGISKGSPELVFPAYGGKVGTWLRLGHKMLRWLWHANGLQLFHEIKEKCMIFQVVPNITRKDEQAALKIDFFLRAQNGARRRAVEDHHPMIMTCLD